MTIYGVQSINYNPQTPAGTPPAQTEDPQKQEMDFLQLLVSQVTNQTPDTPMDPTAMITQYSQMQASIGLIKLNASTRAYQNSALAGSLLHQQVRIKVDDGSGAPNQFVEGKVTALDFSSDSPRVQVNGDYYPLANVSHVGD